MLNLLRLIFAQPGYKLAKKTDLKKYQPKNGGSHATAVFRINAVTPGMRWSDHFPT
jgi:hypothetical protein